MTEHTPVFKVPLRDSPAPGEPRAGEFGECQASLGLRPHKLTCWISPSRRRDSSRAAHRLRGAPWSCGAQIPSAPSLFCLALPPWVEPFSHVYQGETAPGLGSDPTGPQDGEAILSAPPLPSASVSGQEGGPGAGHNGCPTSHPTGHLRVAWALPLPSRQAWSSRPSTHSRAQECVYTRTLLCTHTRATPPRTLTSMHSHTCPHTTWWAPVQGARGHSSQVSSDAQRAWALARPWGPLAAAPPDPRGAWLSPVGGRGRPGEIIWAQGGGPGSHRLLDGGLLAVGLEQGGRTVGQHGPLVAAELGPAVLKPDLGAGGRGQRVQLAAGGTQGPSNPAGACSAPSPGLATSPFRAPLFASVKWG